MQDFPTELAYPIGGPDNEAKFFMFEIHYDNPHLREGIAIIDAYILLAFCHNCIFCKGVNDYSGLRLITTTKYRQTEFGILTVGGYFILYKI